MKTAYEVSLFNWNSGIYFCILATIILVSLFIYYKRHRSKIKTFNFWGIIFSMILLAHMSILGLVRHYTQFYELKSGNYKIVEGEISDLKKDAKGGEYFSVNSQDFEVYSDSNMDQPFHSNDFAKNLSDNKYSVKIYYLGKHILKVEY